MFAFCRWKKNLDPSRFVALKCSTMLVAIADFPTPGCPFNQRMFGALKSVVHSLILFRRSRRVPSRHSPTCGPHSRSASLRSVSRAPS